ncbi:MAG: ISL3 family transposase [Nakamurella sp.]
MEEHVTAVLGMPGFELIAADLVDGEWELLVQTRRDLVGCPACGAVAVVKGRRAVRVRDLPIGGVPVVVVWRKRSYSCRHLLCENKSWTETSDLIAPRSALTERARRWAFDQVAHHDRAVATVAAELGVGWHTVMREVRRRGIPLIQDPVRVAAVTGVGVDETAFLKATGTHSTVYVTGITDLTPGRPARLLDVVQGRSGTVLGGWLGERDQTWRDQIHTASLDPFRGYATALATHLPDAVRVLDPFHVVKLGLTCVDDVRRRVQQETTGHRGRVDDPLYRRRRLLRRRHDRLTDTAKAKLSAALDAGDPDGEVTAAWWIAQQLMAAYHHPHPSTGKLIITRTIQAAKDCPVPEVKRLARTLNAWRTELLARFDHPGVSNGPTENVNLKVKNTKRVARGYRNFDNYRLRLLLNHGSINNNRHYANPIRDRRPTIMT